MLSCLIALIGCDQQSSRVSSTPLATEDAQGFLIQPDSNLAVAGIYLDARDTRFPPRLFLQFSVDGSENSPFLLWRRRSIYSQDAWPTLKPPDEGRPVRRYDFPAIEPNTGGLDPREEGSVSLNSEQLATLENALRKSYEWGKLATAENLYVEFKPLVSDTNKRPLLYFSKRTNSPNFFVWCHGLEIDKRGVDRLLSMISELPSRRQKFLTYWEAEQRADTERRDLKDKEKQRVDQLLR